MKKYRKYGILLTTFIMLSFLTGCKTKYSSIPSETEVMEEVKKACPNESFTLVSKEETGSSPKEVTYSFITDERQLEFEAVSTLVKAPILGDTSEYLYNGTVTDNYRESVSKIYTDDILKLFKQYEYFNEGNKGFEIEDDSHIEEIADAICQAQEIYSGELEYNTQEWMEKHPADHVIVAYMQGEKCNDYIYFDINGISDREEIIQQINEMLAEN